jgi:DNA-directed RNA polymerase subunit M/transcription elongation factor TFIIS
MDQKQPIRTCPKCESEKYMFRSRRKVPAQKGEPEATETKYLCQTCGHKWKVKVADQAAA